MRLASPHWSPERAAVSFNAIDRFVGCAPTRVYLETHAEEEFGAAVTQLEGSRVVGIMRIYISLE